MKMVFVYIQSFMLEKVTDSLAGENKPYLNRGGL